MDAGDFMRIAIGVFFLLFGIGLVYTLFRLAGVFAAAETTVKDVDRELTPVINRLQTTMDQANSELSLVGEITQSVFTTVGAVEHTAVAVTRAVAGPVKAIAAVAAGTSKAVGSLFQPKHKEDV